MGDGGAQEGDDQGNNVSSESDLYHIHAQGYVSGLAAGSQSVMASFNSWKGDKIHGNKYLLTDVLKNEWALMVLWLVIGMDMAKWLIAAMRVAHQAINAGLDIFYGAH